MVRCPRCGARLLDSAPSCLVHGATPTLDEPPSDGPDASSDQAVSRALHEAGYAVQGELGRGGFGVVFAGVRDHDERSIAIKVGLHGGQAAAEEMAREAEHLRAASGPHVPEVLWQGEVAGKPCLVLTRIAHKTLASRLTEQSGAPLPLTMVSPLAFGLLDAVEQIHRAGVVHLDLKPENVLSDDEGNTSIVDFGLARAVGERRQSVPEGGGDPAGTAEYMSPEQCDDLADLDARSDLYSVGVLLYELLSGAPPFWGKPAEVRDAQRSRRPLPLRRRADIPSTVDAVVRACLAKDRAQRPGSIRELREALLIAFGGPARSHPMSPSADKPVADRPGADKPRAQRAGVPAGVKEKRSVGLLFFESRASLGALQSLLGATGGEIAQVKGAQYVVAFGHGVSSNPAKPAMSAAHRLLGSDLATKVLVDVAQVTVELRADGTRRFFGAVLMKQDRFPRAQDALGVMLTAAATEVLPELRFSPVAERDDRFVLGQLATGEGELTVTTFGMDGAPLVGRGELMRQLGSALQAAADGSSPTLFTIKGPSGYGRTHLASAFAESIPRFFPRCSVLRLAPQQDVLGLQGSVLPEMLRQLLDLPASVEPQSAKMLFRDRLGDAIGEEVWAAAAFSMGYIDARHPDVDRLAAAPGALRWAAARAAGEALKLRAQKHPQVVVLDDAHLVDDAVLDALEYATLKESGAAIFACVLAAEDFDERRPGFGTRAGKRMTEPLGPLAIDDAITLARMLLLPVDHVPQAVLTTLVERTQCVPRLLTELIRGLKREGIVRKNESGTGHYIATEELMKLPDLPIVQWNARREIEALSPQLAGHARLAAVLGADFSVGEMDALASALERAGMPEDMQLDPSVGIARLVDAKILRRHRTGRYDFRYPLLRDTLYETVRPERRAPLHAAAFQVYEAAIDMPASRRRPRLALHAAQSGQTERAAQEYLALGRELLDAQAYLPAEAAFGSALASLGECQDVRAVTAARGRGLMRFRLGRHEDAVGDLKLARERAHDLQDAPLEADVMLDEATVLDWRYQIEESAALVKAAQALVPHPEALFAVRLASNLTRVLHRAGDAQACVQVGSEAADKAAALGDAGYEPLVITLLMVAPDCVKLERYADAERHFQTIIEQAEARSDLHHLAAAYINRAPLSSALGQVDRLVTDLEQATRIARTIGVALLEFTALNNLAQALYWSGGDGANAEPGAQQPPLDALRSAAEHAARSAEVATQLWGGSDDVVLSIDLLMARIAHYRGLANDALDWVQHIRARLRAADANEATASVAWSAADAILLEALELAVAGADEVSWIAHAARAAGMELGPEDRLELLELRALAALKAGHTAQARALYEQAATLAREHHNLMSLRVLRNHALHFGAAA